MNSSTINSEQIQRAAKRFSLVLIVGAALLFACTITANVIFDPEGVFGTGVFPAGINSNERVAKLFQYKEEAAQVDGLLFSSSRGQFFDRDELAKQIGANHLLSLSVSYGMITDHLPMFEYILKDKAARGQHIKSVFLLLDVDFFGKQPWTNSNINSFLPPELTGDSPIQFWWRYLTAYQYRLWRDVFNLGIPPAKADGQIPQVVHVPIPLKAEVWRRSWNSIRPDFDRQLSDLQRFVSLCRENNITLTVALSPMIRQNIDANEPAMIEKISERISAITPLWDFNSPPTLADKREYWTDFSHFNSDAASLMIRRMYTKEGTSLPEFGTLRGAP